MKSIPLLFAALASVATVTICAVAQESVRADAAHTKLVADFYIRAPVYSPAPPGTIVEAGNVYLSGGWDPHRDWTNVGSLWIAVASRKLLGLASTTQFYQWYLSIYRVDPTAYPLFMLQYQSPVGGGPLSTVTQPQGSNLWFPVQSLRLIDAARFMQPGTQQLVVESHEMAADCGASTITLFMATAAGKVVPAVSMRNGCELHASIIKGKNDSNAIALNGPYYGPNAAMCCPTKPHATATLSYHNDKWSETPNYFPFYVGKFPPN